MSGTKVASIYELTAKDLHNNDVKLSTFDNNQVLLIVNFSTSDDLCEKNLLELKDLKLKYCDGGVNEREVCRKFVLINNLPQTFQSYSSHRANSGIRWLSETTPRFIAGASSRELSLHRSSAW